LATARRRPLEPVLRRASSSVRETNERVGSSGARRGVKGAWAVPGLSGPVSLPKRCQWRGDSGSGARARQELGAVFKGGRGSWRWLLGRWGTPIGSAATCGRRRANGVRRCGRPACLGTTRGTGLGVGGRHSYPAIVLLARASDRRSLQHLDVRVYGEVRRRAYVAPTAALKDRYSEPERGGVNGSR
jgi:hypothetical protein